MTSEIQINAAVTASNSLIKTTNATNGMQVKSSVQEPQAQPKVVAPKPIDIKFDAIEMRKNLQEAVSFLNQQINQQNRGIGFSIDDSLDTPIVTVRSTVTGEVIRQLPNETAVRLAHNIDRIKGMLINANV